MNARAIAAIVGSDEQSRRELELLAAADRLARVFLIHRRGVLMQDTSGHYGAFDDVARASGYDLEALDREVEAFEPGRRERPKDRDVGAAACNRWTPVVSAAYYFGFALGLRVAATGDRR